MTQTTSFQSDRGSEEKGEAKGEGAWLKVTEADASPGSLTLAPVLPWKEVRQPRTRRAEKASEAATSSILAAFTALIPFSRGPKQ